MTMTRKARGRGETPILDEAAGRAIAPAMNDDALSATDRALLHVSLRRSAEQLQAGFAISADEALAQLRAR